MKTLETLIALWLLGAVATMIEQDPMWVDPNTIRLQEEYQARLERMIGRRPRQP